MTEFKSLEIYGDDKRFAPSSFFLDLMPIIIFILFYYQTNFLRISFSFVFLWMQKQMNRCWNFVGLRTVASWEEKNTSKIKFVFLLESRGSFKFFNLQKSWNLSYLLKIIEKILGDKTKKITRQIFW